jgi:hypothetical protein
VISLFPDHLVDGPIVIENHTRDEINGPPFRIVEESWWAKVVKELNQMSLECARDLQGETGQRWDKGSYKIDLEEAPPTRLLALSVVIKYWL